LKIPADQRQDSLISDPFRQSIHENVVVHPVEKLLQVLMIATIRPFQDRVNQAAPGSG
jgi:hypothetical protein